MSLLSIFLWMGQMGFECKLGNGWWLLFIYWDVFLNHDASLSQVWVLKDVRIENVCKCFKNLLKTFYES